MGVNACQSCGMPLNNEENCGTNFDLTKSQEYCKFCFQEGKFINPNLTIEEVIKKNVEILKKLWMPEEKAIEFANSTIPKLKRWKTEE